MSRGDREAKLLGVPIDDDGGEQVQPCDAEMLALSCTVADFALATDPQCVLQGMMCFPFVEANLCAALHVSIEQPINDKQRPLDTSDFAKGNGLRFGARRNTG